MPKAGEEEDKTASNSLYRLVPGMVQVASPMAGSLKLGLGGGGREEVFSYAGIAITFVLWATKSPWRPAWRGESWRFAATGLLLAGCHAVTACEGFFSFFFFLFRPMNLSSIKTGKSEQAI